MRGSTADEEADKQNVMCFHEGCPYGAPNAFKDTISLYKHCKGECRERCKNTCLMWQCGVIRTELELEQRKSKRSKLSTPKGTVGRSLISISSRMSLFDLHLRILHPTSSIPLPSLTPNVLQFPLSVPSVLGPSCCDYVSPFFG